MEPSRTFGPAGTPTRLVPLCSPQQALAWLGSAVDTVRSWSFLLGTLPDAVRGCTAREGGAHEDAENDPIAQQIFALVLRKLEQETPLHRKRC